MWFWGISLGIVMIILIMNLGIIETLELKSQDFRFHLFADNFIPSDDVVIIAIDQNSLDRFEEMAVSWPLPREIYAVVTDYLSNEGASSVVFDMIFNSRDIERLNVSGAKSDSAFARSIESSGRVTLALIGQDFLTGLRPSFESYAGMGESIELGRNSSSEFRSLSGPIELFQTKFTHYGIANFQSDRDGIGRRLPLYYTINERKYLNLALSAFAVGKSDDIVSQENLNISVFDDHLMVDSTKIPVSESGEFLIFWYGPGGPGRKFDYFSIHDLVVSALNPEKPLIPKAFFDGKYVFVGATAPGLWDLKPTPFTGQTPYPAVEIYATIVSNFIQNHFVSEADSWEYSFLFIILLILEIVIILKYRLQYGAVILGLLIIGWSAASIIAFTKYLVMLPIAEPFTSFLAIFITGTSVSYLYEERSRENLRRMFNRYLSEDVISKLLEDKSGLVLGGEEVEGTVLFVDIVGFTKLVESLSPMETVDILNNYFGESAEAILNNHGLLDKFTGDGLMAIFGVPLSTPEHARQACHSALICREVEIQGKNNQVSTSRIGIHSGKMIVGNIGTAKRTDYTAIGDVVNTASRLEGLNKAYSTRIIISEDSKNLAGDDFAFRDLDIVRVKGKEQPMRIFELIDLAKNINKDEAEWDKNFQKAINVYRDRSYRKAREQFIKLSESLAADYSERRAISTSYANRCEELKKNHNLVDENGIFTFLTK